MDIFLAVIAFPIAVPFLILGFFCGAITRAFCHGYRGLG